MDQRFAMNDLSEKFGIPQELKNFIDDGFLEVVLEKPEEKTVIFSIPSLTYTDESDVETYFTLDWIHPDFNAQFCYCYFEKPGDLPNFYLTKGCRERGDDSIDLDSLDDLLAWLDERRDRR